MSTPSRIRKAIAPTAISLAIGVSSLASAASADGPWTYPGTTKYPTVKLERVSPTHDTASMPVLVHVEIVGHTYASDDSVAHYHLTYGWPRK